MIDKPLGERLLDLLKEVISTITNDDKTDETPSDNTGGNNEENKDEDNESIEPDMGGGVAGF